MSSTNETLASLSGDLKVVYGTTLVQVLPDAAIMQKRHPLSTSGEYPPIGDYFSAWVAVQNPWGVSFLGKGTEGTATNSTLGDALAGQTKPAQVYAATSLLTDNLQYQILDRANSSGSKQAVKSAMSYTGMQMALNFRNVLELQILHGQDGIGASAGAISSLTVTFDGATTAVAILSLLIGARVQWMQSNLTSARTVNDSSNYLTVSAVDVSNPASPTLTMVATGTTNVAAITTGDVMYIGGSRGIAVASSDTNVPQYEQIGLGRQLRLTTGSTVFNIDKSAYIGWVANQQTSIGAFSPSILMQAAALSMSRGGLLGEYEAILSVDQWSVLNSALATNEVYNNPSGFSMSKKTGTDDITVYHSGIKIECIPHPFQKRGQFFLQPKEVFHRIGSTDLTFQVPGREAEEYFYPIAGQAVMQRQCRADFQCANLAPPSSVIGTGVTFS